MPIFPAGAEHLTDDATGSQIAGVLNRVQDFLIANPPPAPPAPSQVIAITGCIIDYAGATPPTGWLVCDGSPVDRTTYAALFTAIGTTWGVGDGVTTFNLPDLRGVTTIGAGAGAWTARTLADVVGEEWHRLTTAEMPSHVHTSQSTGGGTAYATGSNGINSTRTTPDTGSAGSGGLHNNMQPSVVTLKLIHV